MRRILPALLENLARKRPTSTVLFVTNRCNLDCAMCFYTEREQRRELTVQEISRLAGSLPPQWYVMLTGGEPFLRHDVADIAACFYERGAINLHISTNATLAERTVDGVRTIASRCRDARVIVVTSIDGPRRVHDTIRGARGVFDRTVATTRELLALKRDHRNLAVVANLTFSAFNQHCWQEAIDFLRDDLRVDTVNIGLVRGRTKDGASKNVDLDEYRRARTYLAALNNERGYFPLLLRRVAALKDQLQTDTIYRIGRGEPPADYQCLAGTVFGVITETGDVYPCEMLSTCLGNLRDVNMDFMRLWKTDAAARLRAQIAERACLCTYECAMGATMAASGATARGMLRIACGVK